jgi:hypothetical protein
MGESSRTVLLLTWVAGLALGAAGYQGVLRVGETRRLENEKAVAARVAREHERESRPEDLTEAVQARLIAAMISDSECTEEDTIETIRVLVAHPDFINTLWESDHSERRVDHMDSVFGRLASDCPTRIWTVIDHARFSFEGMENFRDAAAAGVRATPEQAFEVAGRKEKLLGATASGTDDFSYNTADYLRGGAVRESREAAQMALKEIAAGKQLPILLQYALLDSGVLREREGQAAMESLRHEARVTAAHTEERETFDAWLHGTPLSDEELKQLPVGDLMSQELDVEGSGIDPQRLEALERIGKEKETGRLLENLVGQGRIPEAMELIDGARNLLPGTRDTLLADVATSIYERTADPQAGLRALEKITDEKGRRAQGEEILRRWAGEAPGEARNYLPQIADADLRARLGEIIEQQSKR